MPKFRFGLRSRIRLMWASESTIIPTRPLTNSSTLSCSFLAKVPGEMTPASFSDLM